MTMKSTENRTCCDGRCCQGRNCPLLRDDPDPLRDDMLEAVTKVILLGVGVAAAGVVTLSLIVHL
jgi:hypothetical protein